MWVKVPPLKGIVTPDQALPTRLGILEGKACNRAELEVKQINHTTAKREMSLGKQVLEKCLTREP